MLMYWHDHVVLYLSGTTKLYIYDLHSVKVVTYSADLKDDDCIFDHMPVLPIITKLNHDNMQIKYDQTK
jgi:hypothetical protein